MYAASQGYELTVGDAFRDTRVHGEFGTKKSYGSANSMHKNRLAMDFNLFVGGLFITDSSDTAWVDLGSYWKTLNPDARWGGDFTKPDGNHFSFTHWGAM